MFKFFDSVLTFFKMIISFIVNLVEGIAMIIYHMSRGIVWLTTAISYMPPLVLGALAALLGLSVVFLIVDR